MRFFLPCKVVKKITRFFKVAGRAFLVRNTSFRKGMRDYCLPSAHPKNPHPKAGWHAFSLRLGLFTQILPLLPFSVAHITIFSLHFPFLWGFGVACLLTGTCTLWEQELQVVTKPAPVSSGRLKVERLKMMASRWRETCSVKDDMDPTSWPGVSGAYFQRIFVKT